MAPGDRKHGGARLVVALARGDTVAAAAADAGVSEATVYRRLREPEFKRRVDEARAEMVAQAVARLSAASTEAADTLRALLSSEMDFARLAAARSILELGARLREHQDLAERVRALEERLSDTKPTNGQGGTKMGGLGRRVAALEALKPECGACEARSRRVYMAGAPAPDRCEGCGRPIEPFVFTLDIDRANGREDDDE